MACWALGRGWLPFGYQDKGRRESTHVRPPPRPAPSLLKAVENRGALATHTALPVCYPSSLHQVSPTTALMSSPRRPRRGPKPNRRRAFELLAPSPPLA
jgi:hypothetical protein